MKYLKLSCVALIAASLSACAGTYEADVDQTIYASEATLSAAERVAQEYRAGQFGTPDATIVSKLQSLDDAAYSTLVPLRTEAMNGTAISTTEAEALSAAVAALTSYISTNKIGAVK